jgi:hypothetical protein
MLDLFKILTEFLAYIKEKKKYWLIPVAVTLFLLGLVIASGGNSPVPVFIYPMA